MADTNNKQPKKAGAPKLTNPLFFGFLMASICFASAFISCQPVEKEIGGASPTPASLTSTQLATFNESINGVSRIESAVIELKGLGTTPPVTDQNEQDLRDALSSTACQISYSRAQVSIGARQSSLSVAGNTCPLIASYESKYSPGTPSGPYSLLASFKISDAAMKAKNDIYEMTLTGSGTHSFADDKGATSTDISGTIQSATKGKITVAITNRQSFFTNQNGKTVEGFRTIALTFPAQSVQQESFKAELRVDFNIRENQDQSKYRLNANEISKAEFDSYLQKLGLLAL